MDEEFTLSPGQSAVIESAGLTITLVNVSSDQRCPLDIECAESGPVTLTITAQKDSSEPLEFILETFTDNNGRAPEGRMEGIQNLVEFEGYVIQVIGVLPFPLHFEDPIKPGEYRVSFIVEKP